MEESVIRHRNEDFMSFSDQRFHQLPVYPRRSLDDLHLEKTSSTYGPHYCPHCQNCSWREFQKCLPNFRETQVVRHATESQKLPKSLLPLFQQQLRVKTTRQVRVFNSFIPLFCRTSEQFKKFNKCLQHKMVRMIGKLVFAIVFVLSAVHIVGYNFKTNTYDGMQIHGPVDPISTKVTFHSIPTEEFNRLAQGASNNWDVLRLFVKDQRISDEELRVHLKMRNGRYLVKKDYDEDDYEYDDDYFRDQSEDDVHNSEIAVQNFIDLRTNWNCSVPKPEIERVSNHGQPHRVYFPAFTVVHRCRNITGCCFESNKECQPNRVQIIEQPFLVLSQQAGSVRPEDDFVETIAFINHTECACKHIQQLPECHCPFPFRVRMEDSGCQCVCHENEEQCQRARCGVDSLSPIGKRCVQDGRCTVPSCFSGDFDTGKGACTHSQRCEDLFRLRLRHPVINGGR